MQPDEQKCPKQAEYFHQPSHWTELPINQFLHPFFSATKGLYTPMQALDSPPNKTLKIKVDPQNKDVTAHDFLSYAQTNTAKPC